MSNPHQQRSAMPASEHRQPSVFSSRRPPAHRSVSLRHSPPKPVSASSMQHLKPQQAVPYSGHASTQTEATSNSDGSPSSLRPLNGRGSSGESSNADKWFDQSNNDPRDNSNSYADNDPPCTTPPPTNQPRRITISPSSCGPDEAWYPWWQQYRRLPRSH
jgi:hypothetical protein